MTGAWDPAKDEAADAQRQLTGLQANVEVRNKQVADLDAQAKRAQHDVADLQDKLNDTKAQFDQASQQRDATQQQLKSTQDELGTAKQTLVGTTASQTEVAAQLQEMQGQSAGKLVAGLLEREHVPQMAYDG